MRAGSLLADIDQAFVSEQRIQNRVKAIKVAAKVAGVGAAAGGIGTAAKLVHDLP